MSEAAQLVGLIIRAGTQPAPAGVEPLPSEPPRPEDQARFDSLIRPGSEPLGPPGPEPPAALDSPERLIAFQSSLIRKTTALDLVGEARSRAEDGIDQLTRG